ncbi:MAG: 3-isopropylmalate dehydratase small subunit [Acidobacteriota bacterium]|nr:3-isopropylmalate dehydratase small subunit [Acidobacteriota bacterium]
MQPFKILRSRSVSMPSENIDTDQIIPARFLKVTDKKGLGEKAFYDWRYDKDGRPRTDFVLNTPRALGAGILVAGDNFGCGSSREHAPWALVDFGFRAVVSTSIADIFRNNALKNGLLPIVVDPQFHTRLLKGAGEELEINLWARTIKTEDCESREFEVEPFARYCLMNGMDQLDFLLGQDAQIQAYEQEYVV